MRSNVREILGSSRAVLLAAIALALGVLTAPVPSVAQGELEFEPPEEIGAPEKTADKDRPEREVRMKITARDPLEAVRERIHPRAAEVPPFPVTNPRFSGVTGWPDTVTLAGVKLKRRIQAWDGYIGKNLKSFREVKSGMRVVASYVVPGTDVSAGWGPRYTWNERGRLIERIWYEPDKDRLITYDYTYYKDGKLLGYSWRSGPRRSDDDSFTEYLSQFYDRSGKLIAVGYEKKVGDASVSAYTWDGQPVLFDDFRMKSHVLYAGAR